MGETETPPPAEDLAPAEDHVPTESRAPARWTRLAVLGLLMEGLGPLLLLAAVLIWGLDFGDDWLFFVVILAIPLLGAFLVWRFGAWAKFVGLLAALLPAGAMFWTAFGLAIPSSFFDFVPGILVIPGFLIAAISCIAGLVAGRRGHKAPMTTGGERIAIRAIPAVVGLLAIISAVLTFAGRSTASEPGADQTLTSKNNAFEPKQFDVNGPARVLIRNDDPFFHTFSIDDLDVDESLTPGDEIVVEIPDRAGTYVFYCRPHTSDPKKPEENDMAGELIIR
jgi:plastocyanin